MSHGFPCVAQDRLVMTGLMELGRASWWHTNFLRAMGAKMGRGVYWDVSAFSVSPGSNCRPSVCCL